MTKPPNTAARFPRSTPDVDAWIDKATAIYHEIIETVARESQYRCSKCPDRVACDAAPVYYKCTQEPKIGDSTIIATARQCLVNDAIEIYLRYSQIHLIPEIIKCLAEQVPRLETACHEGAASGEPGQGR